MDATGAGLLEEAVGWIADIMADDSTRDGEPPTGDEISIWVNDWLPRAQAWVSGKDAA